MNGPREVSPVSAIGWSAIQYGYERADCLIAGRCVHDHVDCDAEVNR